MLVGVAGWTRPAGDHLGRWAATSMVRLALRLEFDQAALELRHSVEEVGPTAVFALEIRQADLQGSNGDPLHRRPIRGGLVLAVVVWREICVDDPIDD